MSRLLLVGAKGREVLEGSEQSGKGREERIHWEPGVLKRPMHVKPKKKIYQARDSSLVMVLWVRMLQRAGGTVRGLRGRVPWVHGRAQQETASDCSACSVMSPHDWTDEP